MLTNERYEQWCREFQIPETAKAIIDRIRTSQPARNVQSGTKNVSGRYPSVKMRRTIQFESYTVELAGVYLYEFDYNVFEYYDQPIQLKLVYFSINNRRMGVIHTPDYFVIRNGSAGFEEWKTNDRLKQLSKQQPGRYVWDEKQRKWRCPPGEEYAARYGFYYHVRTFEEIDWTLQRNLRLLEDYICGDLETGETVIAQVLSMCEANLGVTMEEVLKVATVDDVYNMIAKGKVYVDLKQAPLVELDQVNVFATKEIADAVSMLSGKKLSKNTVDPEPGQELLWNDTRWIVGPITPNAITLIPAGGDGTPIDLQWTLFEQYVQYGKIKATQTTALVKDDEVRQILLSATKEDYQIANERLAAIEYHISGKQIVDKYSHIPARTRRHWIFLYKLAEATWGDGYLGLLPDTSRRQPGARLSRDSREAMLDVIEKQYETSTGISKTAAFGIYKGICEEKGITDPASFKTFCSYINNRPLYLALLKREGRKAAYEFEPEYLEVNLTTPRHGERPWECCYLDHTESDIELKDPVTGETYRPYESVLFDGYSRRVLVIHIQKERPNRETCLAIFRKCVERFGRLPNFIVHDGGAEFSSTDVQIFLARYRIGNKKRPASKSRFGSVQERYFGSKDTILIHNLQGNTKLTKNPRKLTPEVNPKNLAVWTLEAFTQLYEEFCYEVYDKAEHSTLCCSPRAMYEEGIRRTGKRKHKDVSPKDPDFLALTLPSPRRRTAKVQPRRGIKVGGDWFKNALFNAPKVVGTRVEVKCVPENAGVILAYVDGRWIECYSKYYALFKGKSRREIAQITKEIKAQKKASGLRAVISAKDIANFLKKAAIMQTFLAGPVVEVKESVDQAASAGEERYQEQASEIPKDSDAGDDLDNNSETDWEDDWADGEVEEV